LAQGEAGYATFDDLHELGTTSLTKVELPRGSRDSNGNSPRRIPRSLLQGILTNIANLNDPRNRRRDYAPLYLRNLATVASQLPDLPRDGAQQLARYLLAPKSDQQHQAVLQHAEALTRWYSVRLALADEVLTTSTARQRVTEVISRVVGDDAARVDTAAWRERLRDALLREVIEQLAFAAPRRQSEKRIYDDLSDTLRETFVTRARLLGVSADQYSTAVYVSDVMRTMIEHDAAQHSSPNSPVARTNALSASSAESLVAIDYAAENDLQRIVLLQRLWLQRLIANLTQDGAIDSGQAEHLMAELRDADRMAPDLISQLDSGERIQLRVWLLTKPL
jgi:hypothetical protein